MSSQSPLAGRRVLVVEDEPLIAMLLEDMLGELEVETAATADSVPAALQTIEDGQSFDGAILDMNLRGRSVEPVATLLAERRIPFVFASGYGADALTRQHASAPVLSKPFRREALEAALKTALNGVGGT
jgi:CheY-like chemotaxis protein